MGSRSVRAAGDCCCCLWSGRDQNASSYELFWLCAYLLYWRRQCVHIQNTTPFMQFMMGTVTFQTLYGCSLNGPLSEASVPSWYPLLMMKPINVHATATVCAWCHCWPSTLQRSPSPRWFASAMISSCSRRDLQAHVLASRTGDVRRVKDKDDALRYRLVALSTPSKTQQRYAPCLVLHLERPVFSFLASLQPREGTQEQQRHNLFPSPLTWLPRGTFLYTC